MPKHESESTYISMDNTRISEKTFSVPLGFGGYLLTIGMDVSGDGLFAVESINSIISASIHKSITEQCESNVLFS